MGWVCKFCSSNNDDTAENCFVCDQPRGYIPPVIEKAAIPACTLTKLRADSLAAVGGFVRIPDKYTAVGENAFKNRRDIVQVEIPSACTKIQKEAFYGCINLKTVIISGELNSIGAKAFYNCRSLDYKPTAGRVAADAFGADPVKSSSVDDAYRDIVAKSRPAPTRSAPAAHTSYGGTSARPSYGSASSSSTARPSYGSASSSTSARSSYRGSTASKPRSSYGTVSSRTTSRSSTPSYSSHTRSVSSPKSLKKLSVGLIIAFCCLVAVAIIVGNIYLFGTGGMQKFGYNFGEVSARMSYNVNTVYRYAFMNYFDTLSEKTDKVNELPYFFDAISELIRKKV